MRSTGGGMAEERHVDFGPDSAGGQRGVEDHETGLVVRPPGPSELAATVRRVTGLQPLAYHVDVTERLARLEPEGWRAFGETAGRSYPDGLHADLVRAAYRLDPGSHPRVGAAVAQAGAALGVEVPVTVYQLEDRAGADAALLYRRSEAVVTLSGDLLDRLTDPELTALFGHELAHHRLWSLDGGRYGIADRMLDALALDASTPEAFLETARRWNLATELFADRGALAACGDLEAAISCLVKAATGLREVDPAGYVRQAEAADPASGSRGQTHPETVLRAWALHRWQATGTDDAVTTLLRPALDLDRLDLTDREVLEQATRDLIEGFLAQGWADSEQVLAHARSFFPGIAAPRPAPTEIGAGIHALATIQSEAIARPEEPATPIALAGVTPSETVARYLGYVLLDLATVDPDVQELALVSASELARQRGFAGIFDDLATTELNRRPNGNGRRRVGRSGGAGTTAGGRRR